MSWSRRLFDDEAAAQLYAFLAGGIIFMASITVVLYESRVQSVESEPSDAAALDSEALALLDLLLDSPGVGWNLGADNVTRVGLGAANGTGLSLTNLQLMQSGLATGEAQNGFVDNAELVRSLGLDPAVYGVHLTVTPKISPSAPQVINTLAQMRTALIGDWVSIANVTVPLGTDPSMVSAARADVDTTMSANAQRDRDMLAALPLNFDNNLHLAGSFPTVLVDLSPLPNLPLLTQLSDVTLLNGDVYVDDKDYLADVLPGRLSQYDLLIVGSHVDHAEMAHGGLKTAIHDWVDAGGLLVILGSNDSAQQWLDPMLTGTSFKTGLAGPITTGTGSNALSTPNNLQYQKYAFGGTAWNITTVQTPGWSEFSHPLQANGHSVLAISDDGAFGNGTVTFTSLTIDDLWDTVGQSEAGNYVTNVLLYRKLPVINGVTLNFGEPIPSDLPVSTAYRTTHTWFTGYGNVPMDATVHLWLKQA